MLHTSIQRSWHSPSASRSRRPVVRTVALLAAIALSFVTAGCGSDDDDTAVDEIQTTVAAVDSAIDSAVDSVVDDASDEGAARDLAAEIVTALSASATAGEPVMATINEVAVPIVSGRGEITGLDDGDDDGKDDDAKFTVETQGGDDKACVQSQNGTWEVTDDEC